MREPEPIVVTIAHRLGRDIAKERIDRGLGAIRAEVLRYVRTLDYSWEDYRLDFRVNAMMQTISGRIDVMDDTVRVELSLPRLLHLLARPIAQRIDQHARQLLAPPKPGTV